MKKNIYFTTSTDDINKIKSTFSNEKKPCDPIELEKERSYYDETMKLVNEVCEIKSTSWNYWNNLYASKDFELLKKEPYFGSIKIKNEGRIYIGKQSLFDYKKSFNLVHDWRSTFGDAYYSRKTHTFLEKRPIILDDIRKYYNGFYYEDVLNDYSSVLKDELMQKKAGYLGEIIRTIDEIQNEIIRDEHKKAEFILGGPGTGKTTIGLHILSYKAYKFVELNKSYPKILIVVPNLIFKEYISRVLVDLDLYGKNYHNTEIMTMSDFAIRNVYDVDYIFIDESQDIYNLIIDKISKINYKSIYISGDSNQRLLDGYAIEWSNIAKSLNLTENEYRVRTMNINYRNSKKLVDLSNKYILDSQDISIDKISNIQYNLYLNELFPIKTFVRNINFYSKKGNLAIITMPEKIEKIKCILEKNSIKFDLFDNLFESECNVFILSVIESKGLEFDNVITVDLDSNDSVVYNRLMHVALTRSLNDVIVYNYKYDENLVDYYRGVYDQLLLNRYLLEKHNLDYLLQIIDYDETDCLNTVKYLYSCNLITEDFIDFYIQKTDENGFLGLIDLYNCHNDYVIKKIVEYNKLKSYEFLCKKNFEKMSMYYKYQNDENKRFEFYDKYVLNVAKEVSASKIPFDVYIKFEKYLPSRTISLIKFYSTNLFKKYITYLLDNYDFNYMLKYSMNAKDESIINIFKIKYSINQIYQKTDKMEFLDLLKNKFFSTKEFNEYLKCLTKKEYTLDNEDSYIGLMEFLIEFSSNFVDVVNKNNFINFIFDEIIINNSFSKNSKYTPEKLYFYVNFLNENVFNKYIYYLLENYSFVYMLNYTIKSNNEKIIDFFKEKYSINETFNMVNKNDRLHLLNEKIFRIDEFDNYLNDLISEKYIVNIQDYYVELLEMIIENDTFFEKVVNKNVFIDFVFSKITMDDAIKYVLKYNKSYFVNIFKNKYSILDIVDNHCEYIETLITAGICSTHDVIDAYILKDMFIPIFLNNDFVKYYINGNDNILVEYLKKHFNIRLYELIKDELLKNWKFIRYIKFVKTFKNFIK